VVKLLWIPRRRDQREKERLCKQRPAPWRWEARSADSPLVSLPRVARTTVLYTDWVYIVLSAKLGFYTAPHFSICFNSAAMSLDRGASKLVSSIARRRACRPSRARRGRSSAASPRQLRLNEERNTPFSEPLRECLP